MKKKMKALVLFSGGLDSILAAKILEKQGIEVTALTFTGYFFDAEEAKKSAEENGIKLRTENFADVHLGVVKKPRFGRGAGMNPCVDCHLLMLCEAKKIAAREKFDILATGEVLGQRPMSQNSEALKLIEREAGLQGKILRPLSARVLPETEYEKNDIVIREKLQKISGRSRRDQMGLAKEFGVKYYPSPAGGCILTEKEYSKKLRELLERVYNPKPSDFSLLRIGRHFWVNPVRKNGVDKLGKTLSKNNEAEKSGESKLSNGASTHIILGRNHAENLEIKKIAETGDILIDPKGFMGPTALIRGDKIEISMEASIEAAKEKILKYSKNYSRAASFEIYKQ